MSSHSKAADDSDASILTAVSQPAIEEAAQITRYRYLPLGLVFFSGLAFSAQNLLVKVLSNDIGTFQIVCCRGFIQLVITTAVLATARVISTESVPLFGPNRYTTVILLFRAIFGFGGMLFGFMAIEMMPIGDATTIIMLSPMLASFLGIFVLSEPWHLLEICAALVSLMGIALVSQPLCLLGRGRCSSSVGIACAVAAAFSSAGAYLTVRILGTTAIMPWYNVTFAQSLGLVIFSLFCMLIFQEQLVVFSRKDLPGSDMVLLILAGLIGTAGQFTMTIGMQREKSALATAMRSSDILFGFIFQVVYTDDALSIYSVMGACLVLVGILIILMKKQCDKQETTNQDYKYGRLPVRAVDDAGPRQGGTETA